MLPFIKIIQGNYLQYVRSYSFLITVGICVYVALSLVPSPEANYTTIRLGEFTGDYNSTWIALVMAMMASVLLSLVGFFLMHGSIQKDIETRIGHIIGTTQISNSSYLFSKFCSNLLILFTMLCIVFVAGIALLFMFGNQYSLQLWEFVIPFVLIAVPTLVIVTALALVLEVVFPRKRNLQYGIFLVLYISSLVGATFEKKEIHDAFGIHEPMTAITTQVQQQFPNEDTAFTIGFISGKRNADKVVTIQHIAFSADYIWNRVVFMLIAIVCLFLSTIYFHRFNIKEKIAPLPTSAPAEQNKSAGFQLSNLSITPEFSSQLSPLVSAEIIMLIRKTPKWLLGISFCLMFASIFVPLPVAHHYMLPLLWFLQVGVWSDLVTKDTSFRTYYFTASSYKPLQRVFISRILAGIGIAIFIALPLLVRYIVEFDVHTIINIMLGAVFIILLSVFFGTLTRSKKLFEITFFFLIYSNINLVKITDYFGALHNSIAYTILMLVLSTILFFSSYSLKKLRYES
ncbi:MAG: hypothetical protein AAF617_06045 [Bacteroidota bacterium]